MSISFHIIKPRQTLEKQWNYLIKRGHDNTVRPLKKFSVRFLIFTILLYSALHFLTSTDDLVVLKVMSIIAVLIVWCIVGLKYLSAHWETLKSKRRLRKMLHSITDSQLRYSVLVDDEKVTITSSDYNYELPWIEFSLFGVHEETLYVFNHVNNANSMYWDQNEMGNEAYTAFIQLLRQKPLQQLF